MEDWLSDEIRRRSAFFWARRADGWPLQSSGYVFMANAICKVGEALFQSDWTGHEPAQWVVPVLDRPPPYGEFDQIYAMTLLMKYRPDSPPETSLPLTREAWKAAADLYRDHEAGPRAAAKSKMTRVHQTMIEALAGGELLAATRANGTMKLIQPMLWTERNVSYARLLESQMDPANPFVVRWPSIYEAVFDEHPPELVPGNEWIFVTEASLQAFLETLKAPGKPPISTRYYSDDAIDTELKKLYSEFANSVADRPKRDGPGGVVDLMRQRLVGVQVERVKERYTKTRPADWKQGKRSVH